MSQEVAPCMLGLNVNYCVIGYLCHHSNYCGMSWDVVAGYIFTPDTVAAKIKVTFRFSAMTVALCCLFINTILRR